MHLGQSGDRQHVACNEANASKANPFGCDSGQGKGVPCKNTCRARANGIPSIDVCRSPQCPPLQSSRGPIIEYFNTDSMRHKLPLATAEEVRQRACAFSRALRSAPESRGLRMMQSLPVGIYGFKGMQEQLPELKNRFVNNPNFSGLCTLLEQDLIDIESAIRDELLDYVATLRNLASELEFAYDRTLRELASALPSTIRADPIVSQLINSDPRHIPAKQAYEQRFESTLARFGRLAETLKDRTHQATVKFMTLTAAVDCHVCPGNKKARAAGDRKDMIDYVIKAQRANPNKGHEEVYEIAQKDFHAHFDDKFLSKNYVMNEWRRLLGFNRRRAKGSGACKDAGLGSPDKGCPQ